MRSVSILSIAGLLAAVAAQPMMDKRADEDVVIVTKVEEVVKTVDVTTTVTMGAPTPSPNPPAHPSPVQPPPPPPPQHHHHKIHHLHNHKPSPPPAPSTTEPAAAPPAPPTHAAPPPPPPSPKPEPSPKTPSGGSSAAPSDAHVGEMTHYAPGLGSCGFTDNKESHIVALATDMMGYSANPNDNPNCGKTITIEYDGQQHQATVHDTCAGCATTDIDLSPKLFQLVAPAGGGRIPGVKWWFNN